MRLWSLHPRYLDPKGLVAVWREGLLALAVLKGNTKGYTRHPQLDRFRAAKSPAGAVKCYLWAVYQEAKARGYRFNPSKIRRRPSCTPIPVTTGQLAFEMAHLKGKLRTRHPATYSAVRSIRIPQPHPLFTVTPGGVENWEKSIAPVSTAIARKQRR
jgi:hypothetical protein